MRAERVVFCKKCDAGKVLDGRLQCTYSLLVPIQPQQIFIDDLDQVCQKLGAHVQVVPTGVELIPPQQHVKQLGKVNRSLREQQDHLNYVFDMMDGADFEEEGLLLSGSESSIGIGVFE